MTAIPTPVIETAILGLKTITLVLGGLITYFAFKAYRETNHRALWLLSVGFGVVTLGALFAGVAHQILGVDLTSGILINSLLTAIGFAIITYSLYVE